MILFWAVFSFFTFFFREKESILVLKKTCFLKSKNIRTVFINSFPFVTNVCLPLEGEYFQMHLKTSLNISLGNANNNFAKKNYCVRELCIHVE